VRELIFGPDKRFETSLDCHVAAFRLAGYPLRTSSPTSPTPCPSAKSPESLYTTTKRWCCSSAVRS
jgi:hypothetical protein